MIASRPGRPARVVAPLVILALLLAGPAVMRAAAEPASGAVEVAGTPPGSVEVTTPEVAQKGAVSFCVHGFRVEKGGTSVGQQFMVKLDDFGAYGIGPFTPSSAGDLCASVSTDPAAHESEKGGAKDKIPTDLCDPGKEHWLRFLSGSWAQEGSPRSLTAKFRMTGSCETAPTTPTGGGGGGTTTTPTEAAPVPTTVKLVDRRLALGSGAVTLRLRAPASAAAGKIVLRAARKVRIAGPHSPRRKAVLARGAYRVSAGETKTLRIKLTATGKRVLSGRDRLGARLLTMPTEGEGRSWSVSLRRPQVESALAMNAARAALATPVTFEQASTGAKVTINSEAFVAGERIEVEGSGFTPETGTEGHPLVVVKVDKLEVPWAYGGESAHAGNASPRFEAADDGTFDGWIEVPSAFATGPHTLYFLSGSESTGDKKTKAISVSGPIAVTAPPPAGALSTTSVHPGDTISVSIFGWTAEAGGGQKVALKIDAGATLGCVQTDAAGNGTGTVVVPTDIEPGEHAVRLLAGSECVSGSGTPQPPARSQALPFTVLAPAPAEPSGGSGSGSSGTAPGGADAETVAPPVSIPAVKKAWIAGGKLALRLAGGSGAKVKVVARTAGKARLAPDGKKRILTLARGTTRLAAGVVRLPLTRSGRALVREGAPIAAKVALSSVGAKTRIVRVKLG